MTTLFCTVNASHTFNFLISFYIFSWISTINWNINFFKPPHKHTYTRWRPLVGHCLKRNPLYHGKWKRKVCDIVCSVFVSVVSCRFGCETITSYCHLNHLKQACFHSLLLLQLYTVRSHRWNIQHISSSMTSSYGNMKTAGWWLNYFLAYSLGQIWHWQYSNETMSVF